MKTPEQEKGAGGTCATVKIRADNELGYVVINEDDFDPAKYEKFEKLERKPKIKVGAGG
jgi:hypothetical protein